MEGIMKSRALRRYHLQRTKQQVKKFWRFRYSERWPDFPISLRDIGVSANTKQICSKRCCGNQRQHEGHSLQELKQIENFKEQLRDLNGEH